MVACTNNEAWEHLQAMLHSVQGAIEAARAAAVAAGACKRLLKPVFVCNVGSVKVNIAGLTHHWQVIRACLQH